MVIATEQLQFSDVDNPVRSSLKRIFFSHASKTTTLRANIEVTRQILTRFNPRILYK